MTFRPDSSRVAGRLPSSIQRRTVSSLTPNSSAASRTRMDVTAAYYPHMRSKYPLSSASTELCLGELLLGVEPGPLLAGPDRHVDVGPLGAQRGHGRLLLGRAGEGVPAEEVAGVLP